MQSAKKATGTGVKRRKTPLTDQLKSILGHDGVVRLAECFAGSRLYVPAANDVRAENLIGEIGAEAVKTLASEYAGDYLRVPLFREERTEAYLKQGLSNVQIALRLGMTESGVNKLKARMLAK